MTKRYAVEKESRHGFHCELEAVVYQKKEEERRGGRTPQAYAYSEEKGSCSIAPWEGEGESLFVFFLGTKEKEGRKTGSSSR